MDRTREESVFKTIVLRRVTLVGPWVAMTSVAVSGC